MAVYLSDESGNLHKVAGNGPIPKLSLDDKVDKQINRHVSSEDGNDTTITNLIKNDSEGLGIMSATFLDTIPDVPVCVSGLVVDTESILQMFVGNVNGHNCTTHIVNSLEGSSITSELEDESTGEKATVSGNISASGFEFNNKYVTADSSVITSMEVNPVLGFGINISQEEDSNFDTKFLLGPLAANIKTPSSEVLLHVITKPGVLELSAFDQGEVNKSTLSVQSGGILKFNGKDLLTVDKIDEKIEVVKKEIETLGGSDDSLSIEHIIPAGTTLFEESAPEIYSGINYYDDLSGLLVYSSTNQGIKDNPMNFMGIKEPHTTSEFLLSKKAIQGYLINRTGTGDTDFNLRQFGLTESSIVFEFLSYESSNNFVNSIKMNGADGISFLVQKQNAQTTLDLSDKLLYNNKEVATTDYVDQNGGKIASISVNGTKQTIDSSKNVDLKISILNLGETPTTAYAGSSGKANADAILKLQTELSTLNSSVNTINNDITEIKESIDPIKITDISSFSIA